MGLRVNTNVASINAQRNLSQVNERLSGNFRRLATGLRGVFDGLLGLWYPPRPAQVAAW